MARKHDVLVVGGGHNGLTAAAYMAKAGFDVAVVERQPYVGGGVVTLETNVPGFKHDVASTAHFVVQANPLLRNDELGLKAKYGLDYVFIDDDPCVSVVFSDGDHLSLYRDVERTCRSIATRSPRDAEAYRRFAAWTRPILDMLIGGFFTPPPPFGALFATLDQPGPGRELLRAMQMSSLDIIDEWFEDERVKAFLARFVSEVIVSPDEIGTGSFLFTTIPLLHTYGMAIPVGGSGALSEALARCIRDNGGTIYTGAEAARILVDGGTASGVRLASGEEIIATRAVIADLNIRQIPQLLGEGQLEPGFMDQVRRCKTNVFTGVNINLALNEAPDYLRGNEELHRSFLVELCPSLTEMRQTFDGFRYGKPGTDMPCVVCATNHDPSRAPTGKHTLYAFQYEPYRLAEGSWTERKEEIADRVIGSIARLTRNMGGDNILGRTVTSPADLAAFNTSWLNGDSCHLRNMVAQYFSHRPFPEAGNYRLPPNGLYLCGPSTHPGSGVTCGARAAAMTVMADLGIDFERVVA